MSQIDVDLQRKFVGLWSNAIASVMGQIAGAEWTAESREVSPAQADAAEIHVGFTLQKVLAGKMRLTLGRKDAWRLIAIFTGDEATSEWNAEQQEAIEELCRQFAGQVATALKPERGEVDFKLAVAPDFAAVEPAAAIELTIPDAEPILLCLEIDIELQRSLTSQTREENPSVPTPSLGENQSANNLDLLMHVELSVTLRFGQREMLLQDILDLQSGSVIELDREIQEPVDLVLDGRIIARGQVVVVDGNYGLRVSEVGPAVSRA